MNEFIAVAMITILAVISPGADFAIVTRNSYLHGRKIGLFTAFGIALGVLVHVTYTLVALTFVVSYTPVLIHFIKYLGAGYLIYLAYKTFTQTPISDISKATKITSYAAFKNGFLTNALNPKTMLFVLSTFTQITSSKTSLFILLNYGLFMSFAHFFWFSIVAVFFSNPSLRDKMLQHQVRINQIIGIILFVLASALIFNSSI
jgi:threonine/homoserine/homoserine lactone efflux protein